MASDILTYLRHWAAMKSTLLRYIKAMVQYGDFTLASGKKSDHYIDLRLLTMNPNGLRLVGTMLEEKMRPFCADGVGGMATAAIPLVSAILMKSKLHINGFYLRKDAKVHGMGKDIEGTLLPKSNVVIVDDVATSGGSIVKVIERVLQEDCRVVAAMCILDRMEGAGDLLARMDIPFVALATLKEVFCSDE